MAYLVGAELAERAFKKSDTDIIVFAYKRRFKVVGVHLCTEMPHHS